MGGFVSAGDLSNTEINGDPMRYEGVKAPIPGFSVSNAKTISKRALKISKKAIPLADGNTFVDNVINPRCVTILNYNDGSGRPIQISDVGVINISCY